MEETILNELPKSSELNQKLLMMLGHFQKNLNTLEAEKIFAAYFALLDDGSSCLTLDAKALIAKCEALWKLPLSNELKTVLEKGCAQILNGELSEIVTFVQNENAEVKTPFVVEEKSQSLFASKYWTAKNGILKTFDASSHIFTQNAPKETAKDVKNFVKGILRKGSPIDLKDAQVQAILQGQSSSLLITGGPGTGKTTVVLFLLWKLLSDNAGMRDWNLYFAAPSGKAANRLKESLDLSEIDPELLEKSPSNLIAEKFKNAEGLTMHRLLKYNAGKNAFTFNEKNPFPENSIFVVDEASMIDISLFAAFLKALPKDPSKFRLFILGDKNQLPSVNAGAVLGEVLGKYPQYMVELSESNRFLDDSKMGRFAHAIQKDSFEDCEKSLAECGGFQNWDDSKKIWPAETSQVNFISLDEKVPKKQLLQIISQWVDAYCAALPVLASEVDPSAEAPEGSKEWEARNRLWKRAEQARILSAERRGICGVETLNRMVRDAIRSNPNLEISAGAHFAGEILMFNRNQNMMKLFNGDSGVVVKKDGVDYLMIKKDENFVCYQLALFPSDCLESAFAITIHKSQGSGYKNILMFLPQEKGHPLLNRQILYTGVTRTKVTRQYGADKTSFVETGTLSLVSDLEHLQEAQQTILERDTGIYSA
ncbi:MAG: AAA family ATPase [Fibrobacter sp.]|nr:AAA family ATPase [Fibrobacter sp.]